MSKRFLDTGFLEQKWIRKLSPEKKTFLIYLMLKCDNGGIIDLDLEDASFWIGKEIKSLDFLPEDYLIPLNDSSKYFMPKFIEWQYKDLSSQKFIVAQARQILEKHDLINADFTLKLPKSYVNITKDVPESQEQGKGIGKDKGGVGEKPKPFDFKKSLIDLGIEEKIVSDWLIVRKKKDGANTETAFNAIKKQIELSGSTPNECIKKAVEKSWCGFEAGWMKNNNTPTDYSEVPYRAKNLVLPDAK
jgi:hypothetical protein